MFVIPILFLYYEAHKGVSVQGMYIVESAFSLGVLLTTIPAGYLSDVWKRMHVLSLGAFLVTLGFVVELFGFGLYQMALGEFLVGVGFAFSGSSAISALAYDTLLEKGDTKKHLSLQSTLQIIHISAMFFAVIAAAYMFAYYPDLPMLMMVIFCALGGFITLFLDEPERSKEPSKKSMFLVVKDMWDVTQFVLHKHKEIACIVFFTVVLCVTTKLGLWMHQPFFKQIGVAEQNFGWLMAGFSLCGIIGARMAKYEMHIKPVFSVLFALLMPVVCYSVAALLQSHLSLVFLMLMGAVYNYISPVIKHAINERVSSERRATVLSVKEFCYHLGFIAVAWKVGAVVEASTPTVGMLTIATGCGVLGIVVFYCLKKHKVV